MNLNPGEVKCDKCNGKGKLDWIENVVGVKKKDTMADLNKRIFQQNVAKFQSEAQKAQMQAQQQYDQYNQQMAAISNQIGATKPGLYQQTGLYQQMKLGMLPNYGISNPKYIKPLVYDSKPSFIDKLKKCFKIILNSLK